MNYLAHGWHFLDDAYFLAGTAVPDWLCVADRPVRARAKHAVEFIDDADPQTRALACGIVQHHRDDARFHDTRAFVELSLQFAAEIRAALAGDEGFRPGFLGHILVELLLDGALIEEAPHQLETYYRQIASVDPSVIQASVNRLATRPTDRLAWFIMAFSRERFLWDYLDDGKLVWRLNQVMQRVGLPQLPMTIAELIPAMRMAVRKRRLELLPERGRAQLPSMPPAI